MFASSPPPSTLIYCQPSASFFILSSTCSRKRLKQSLPSASYQPPNAFERNTTFPREIDAPSVLSVPPPFFSYGSMTCLPSQGSNNCGFCKLELKSDSFFIKWMNSLTGSLFLTTVLIFFLPRAATIYNITQYALNALVRACTYNRIAICSRRFGSENS